MTEPLVTLVVVPRERFSYAPASLESLYEHTQLPFKLVYVDGNSPPKLKRYLEEQSRQKKNSPCCGQQNISTPIKPVTWGSSGWIRHIWCLSITMWWFLPVG